MTNAGNYGDTFTGIAAGQHIKAADMTSALNSKEKVANKQIYSTAPAEAASNTLSGSSSNDYYPSAQLVGKNLDSILPVGTILAMKKDMYASASQDFKNKWKVCDGQNGTPNLIDKFLRGGTASSTESGGADSQDISISAANLPNHTHTVNDPGHSHKWYNRWGDGANSAHNDTLRMANSNAMDTLTTKDTTGITVTGGGSNSPTAISVSTVPKYYTVIYIMKTT